ncbi:MAG: TIGR02206 family membrane protein [Bacteroidales bacterium]|nr:TIGR02206 family membrane protein [Bacteroidales bacterium]
MQNFFNPTRSTEVEVPMFGSLHLITMAIMPALVLLVLWKKEAVKRILANRKVVTWFVALFLGLEVLNLILLWSFKFEPFFERFPLHLCYTLSLLIPVLMLKERYDLLQIFCYWSLGSGFISFVNPSYLHTYPMSFEFIHYCIRHYFLFIIPIMLQVGIGFRHSYRIFRISMFTLASYAFFIFLLNWATGANYMHLGQNNPVHITFLPDQLNKWPWTYPSFVVTGILLLHIGYFSLLRMERQSAVVNVSR